MVSLLRGAVGVDAARRTGDDDPSASTAIYARTGSIA